MILGKEEIQKLVDASTLIENFSEDCLEGAGYDLRLNCLHRISGSAFIGEKERFLPDSGRIASARYNIEPGEYFLAETVEKLNMPHDLAAIVLNRSSLFRAGCSLSTALVDPGYRGALVFGLKNLSDVRFEIEKGARFAQIVFLRVAGKTTPYSGRYQGGKVL